MRSLLDINILIALLDQGHIHHEIATKWLWKEIRNGWASCPITQNGTIRIMSNSNYPASLAPNQIVHRLSLAVGHPSHEFWADDISILDEGIMDWSFFSGPKQTTDLYLLALAVRHGGRFVTMDHRTPWQAIKHANSENILVLSLEKNAR